MVCRLVPSLGALVLVACTFEGAPVGGSDPAVPDGGLGGTDATAETDANSVFDDCEPLLVLESTKFHDPPSLVVDSRVYPPGVSLEFFRPVDVLVTAGNAGGRCAFLDYTSTEGKQVRCAYEGRGQGTEFDFIACQDALEASFRDCGDAEDSQSNVNHQPIHATALTLVVDGDATLPSTVGEMAISGTCESQ